MYCTLIEQFWLRVRTINLTFDDQERVNKALDSMSVQWRQLNDDKYYKGITSGDIPLRIMTLPSSVICRQCSIQVKSQYYVWHQLTQKLGNKKKTSLSSKNFWLLNDDWNSVTWNSTLLPEQWLMNISKSS